MSAYSSPRRCRNCGGIQYQALVDVTTFGTPVAERPALVLGPWDMCHHCGSTAEPVDMPEDPFVQKT